MTPTSFIWRLAPSCNNTYINECYCRKEPDVRTLIIIKTSIALPYMWAFMDFKTLLCYNGDQSSLTTPGTIVHTQPAGRLAVTLQWLPQFAVSGKAWQHKTNCSTLPVNWSNADIPISHAWMPPRGHCYVNLALLLDFPPSAAAEGGVNNNNNNNEYPQWSVIDQSPSAQQVTRTHPRK